MSERYTEVEAPGVEGSGYAMLGRMSRPDAIQKWRRYHEEQLARSQAALAVSDKDLTVALYLGPWARDRYELIDPPEE